MTWPLNESIRPYIRMATYWIDQGYSAHQVMEWAAESRHHYNLDYMAQAIPEARRAIYFRERILETSADIPLSKAWGWYARGAWYAGYGRAPTEAEREWAYTRPGTQLGLFIEVSGTGAMTGAPRSFRLSINVPWTATRREIQAFLRAQLREGGAMARRLGYEPLSGGRITFQYLGGALLDRQLPSLTMP